MMESISILQLGDSSTAGFNGSEDYCASKKDTSKDSKACCSASSAELLAYSMKDGENNEEEDENKVTDVHALLAQKEKDLILAAELGKALLEKNEDLSQQNERMALDFSKQLEVRRH